MKIILPEHILTTIVFSSMGGLNNSIFGSLNILSLMSNHEQLSLTIINLNDKTLNIAAIALQEVGRFPILTLLRCPLILNTRNNSRGGGVSFYLYDSLDFSVLCNHSLFIVKEFECLTIETFLHGKKVILSNIYRSLTPTPNISVTSQIVLFINRLESHLHSYSLLCPDTFVFRDSNIDLLKPTSTQTGLDYLKNVHNRWIPPAYQQSQPNCG
jgi:hypothetical protein